MKIPSMFEVQTPELQREVLTSHAQYGSWKVTHFSHLVARSQRETGIDRISWSVITANRLRGFRSFVISSCLIMVLDGNN